jgi:CDP-glycerol glycerophosphotransferase (TagB/SpsB family)
MAVLKSKVTFSLLIKYAFFYIVSIPLTIVLPRKKNMVILSSDRGEGMTGNAQCLFEKWTNDTQFQAFYLIANKALCAKYQKIYPGVLYSFSWRALWYSSRARFFVFTHGRIDIPFCGFRKILLQTFHGIPLKAIGFYQDKTWKNKIRNRLYKLLDYDRIQYYLSSSPFVSTIYSVVFRQPIDKFIETGFPRNDMLIRKTPDPTFLKAIVGAKSQTKIILYAPTHRPYQSTYFPFVDFERFAPRLIELLEKHDRVLLLRSHRNQMYPIPEILAQSSRVIDITTTDTVQNIQELILHVDLLLTDYSSIHLDAILADIPCFFLTPDRQQYVQETGDFCCDYDLLAAGPKIETMEQLINELQGFISAGDTYAPQRDFVRRLCYKEGGKDSFEQINDFLERIA